MENPHIYIVDDDRGYNASLRRLLRSHGYPAETFSSAKSFFDSVPKDSKGFLLLDLRMPEMDGFEVFEKLKALGYDLQVIIMTAYAEAGDREYLMEQGAYAFLMKPFEDSSLLELITKDSRNGKKILEKKGGDLKALNAHAVKGRSKK